MRDKLRERLERLDPMHSGVPTEPTTTESSQKLMETIMSTPTKQPTDESNAPPRRIWTVAVAAVAVLILAVAGGIAFSGDETPPTTADEASIELTAAGEDVMASCIMFSPEELEKVAEIAFEGTVTSVEGDTVALTVDRWYRGGESSQVTLRAPQGLEALIGGIPFRAGDQYLISAQDGNVNYCGFSGASTPELKAGFEAAFPSG